MTALFEINSQTPSIDSTHNCTTPMRPTFFKFIQARFIKNSKPKQTTFVRLTLEAANKVTIKSCGTTLKYMKNNPEMTENCYVRILMFQNLEIAGNLMQLAKKWEVFEKDRNIEFEPRLIVYEDFLEIPLGDDDFELSTQDLLNTQNVMNSQAPGIPKVDSKNETSNGTPRGVVVDKKHYSKDQPANHLDCFKVPINKLTPIQNQSLWQICVKLLKIGPLEKRLVMTKNNQKQHLSNSKTNLTKKFIEFQHLILSDSTGDIKLILLNEFVEKYNYDALFLKVGKIYRISGCRIRPSFVDGERMEIVSEEGMRFYELNCSEEFEFPKSKNLKDLNNNKTFALPEKQPPKLKYQKFDPEIKFTTIKKTKSLPEKSVVHIIAIVKQVHEVEMFSRKTNTNDSNTNKNVFASPYLKKLTLTLVDTTKSTIKANFFGPDAEDILKIPNYTSEILNNLILIRNGKISFKNSISINADQFTVTNFYTLKQILNEKKGVFSGYGVTSRAVGLATWYQNFGHKLPVESFENLSNRLACSQLSESFTESIESSKDLKDLNLVSLSRLISGTSGKIAKFSAGRIVNICVFITNYASHNFKAMVYNADPETNRKIIQKLDGSYFNPSSNQNLPKSFKPATRILIPALKVNDWTDENHLTLFHNEAKLLLNISDDELELLGKEHRKMGNLGNNVENLFLKFFKRIYCQRFFMQVRITREKFNDTFRTKYVVVAMKKVKNSEAKKLEALEDKLA